VAVEAEDSFRPVHQRTLWRWRHGVRAENHHQIAQTLTQSLCRSEVMVGRTGLCERALHERLPDSSGAPLAALSLINLQLSANNFWQVLPLVSPDKTQPKRESERDENNSCSSTQIQSETQRYVWGSRTAKLPVCSQISVICTGIGSTVCCVVF
jgi:hypothetical protein